jgi:hypothetical protein
MDANLFRTRIAPLLSADDLRALRLVKRSWQWVVDQLIPVKGAFGLRRKDKLTIPDVCYAHAVKLKIDSYDALMACAGGELTELQWALATFRVPLLRDGVRLAETLAARLTPRVARLECMELLVQVYHVRPVEAFLSSCVGGHLAVAQWLARTLDPEARGFIRPRMEDTFLRSCESGHVDVATWLTQTFDLTAADTRSRIQSRIEDAFIRS